MAILCTGLLVFAVVADLGDADRRQLATARDFSPLLDEAAFYPLLHDAMGWGRGEEGGAVVPDFAAIAGSPSRHRGRVYLLEGTLRRIQRPARFSRSGAWETRWRQWIVQFGRRPSEVAVVYLVVPPDGAQLQARVRLPARFYKIWRDTDQLDGQTDYPVFVGHSAQVVPADSRDWSGAVGVLALLAVVLAVYLGLRRKAASLRPGATPPSTCSLPDRRGDEPLGEQGTGPSLPTDPADALSELERRRRQTR